MAAGDLTDLDTVKCWLGVSTTTTDGLLGGLITAVSAFIVNYLGRQILSGDYVETYRGNGQSLMLLRGFPITAVASVAFAG
ncbi:MAG TPA: phage head-tail connector protein, partial [Caulobacteraceae bacterium]|nr:phage head-tail connector protein [Caulobacteraceae bacterium]